MKIKTTMRTKQQQILQISLNEESNQKSDIINHK